MDCEAAAGSRPLEPAARLQAPSPGPGPGAGRLALAARVTAFVEATKFRSVFLLTAVGLAAGVFAWRVGLSSGAVAPGSLQEAAARTGLVLGTLAVLLGSMGANAITGAIDHRMDALMSRTRHRPVPTGRLTPGESLWFGIALVGLALLVVLAGGYFWSAVWLLGGVLNVTLLYNGWSKTRTPWSVVLGTPGSAAPVLVVSSAVAGTALGPGAVPLAALVAAWTPIHVWSLAIRYVDDYRASGVPMLPVAVGVRQAARCVGWASLALCAAAAVLPAALGLGPAANALVLTLQVPVLVVSLAVTFRPTAVLSWTLFKLTSPYLALVFLVVATMG